MRLFSLHSYPPNELPKTHKPHKNERWQKNYHYTSLACERFQQDSIWADVMLTQIELQTVGQMNDNDRIVKRGY